MGYVIGLGLGVGLLLLWSGLTSSPVEEPARAPRHGRVEGLLVRAGAYEVSVVGFLGVCVACAAVGGVLALLVTATPTIALLGAGAAAYVPVAVMRARANRVAGERAACWPDAIDQLASAVRAGMSLPESVASLGERGPVALRDPFAGFARDYQATGRYGESLDVLKRRLSDPVGDRVVEALRLARDVGGGDLGRMLRTLSTFVRDDLRTRGELVSRQAWAVNGARLAVAAPWIVLVLMAPRREAISQFGSGTGLLILLSGAGVCVLAYRVMLRIGRLPSEPRVLR